MPLANLGTSIPRWDVHCWIWTNTWIHLPAFQKPNLWDEDEAADAVQEVKGQLLQTFGPWHWFWIGRYEDEKLRQSEMVRLPW